MIQCFFIDKAEDTFYIYPLIKKMEILQEY